MSKENDEFAEWLDYGTQRGWVSEVHDAIKDYMPMSDMEERAYENEDSRVNIPYVRIYGPRYFDSKQIC